MKIYVLMHIYDTSARLNNKAFLSYEVAKDYSIKLQKEDEDKFYQTFGHNDHDPIRYAIYDVDLDI